MAKLVPLGLLLLATAASAACGDASTGGLWPTEPAPAGPSTSSGSGGGTGTAAGGGGNADSGAPGSSGGSSSGGSSGGGSSSGGSSSGGGATSDAGGGGNDGASSPPPTPAGTDASTPAPTDVFTGAPPFVSTVASSTHNAGQNCMGGCHDHGFTFAGTLTDGAGNGVAGAEVRLVDANGTAISVHTGSNGNFHSSTAFVGPANVGARDATNKALMVTALVPANGGCNGCHVTGGTMAPIHLP